MPRDDAASYGAAACGVQDGAASNQVDESTLIDHRTTLRLFVLLAVVAAGSCSSGADLRRSGVADGTSTVDEVRTRDGNPVEYLASKVNEAASLGPDLRASTELGALRERYLPVWSSDLDWAFPPEVCGSAWELDAIAEPDSSADVGVLGDTNSAAALSVVRFEYFVSRAFAEPTPLSQLCVAVASVDPVRRETLNELEPHIRSGRGALRDVGPPQEVTIVAVGVASALAVACSGNRLGVAADGDAQSSESSVQLGAYLLRLSSGQEDVVADVSWRVSQLRYETAPSCVRLAEWAARWHERAQQWVAEGQAWLLSRQTVSVADICTSSPTDSHACLESRQQ